jgi:energy-converting hydrogenase Eha subunit A
MFKRTMIASGIALALVTGAPMAADQPQQVTFELQAVITAPVFSA